MHVAFLVGYNTYNHRIIYHQQTSSYIPVSISFQADESEIMLAVDNGNVEVYDRHSLELKTALVGQVRTDDIHHVADQQPHACGKGLKM